MFPRPSGIVTLTTDFGLQDPYVGILKGALLRASDKPRMLDITHDIPAQDVAAGSFVLWSLQQRFPAGTVHVGVVDPGVGTARQLLAICAHGQYWLVPDNGMIGAVLADAEALEVRVLDLEHLRIKPESCTFDGRDVLAPVAAWLATGRYGFSAMGPIAAACERRDLVFAGEARVVHVDRYGNLVSNVRAAALAAGGRVMCGERELQIGRSYADVEPGQPLAYVGSFGLLEVAVREGNASEVLGMQRGAPIGVTSP